MKEPKVILITGASSGLGAALAHEYAVDGTTLLLTGRNEEKLQGVATTCQERGAKTEIAAIDVKDAEALKQWIIEVNTQHPIDLVISNAGISAGTGGDGESEEQARNIFSTNVDGVLNTILPIIPLMQARKRGQIAIMSSLAGLRGLPGAPAYSASKAAVKVYGEALRGDLADSGIGVTVICPGYIKTPMTDVNDFPMPLLMEAEKAAKIIKQRLQNNPARIAFPFPMYFVVWLLSCLSPRLTDPLFRLMPKKP